MPIGRISDTPMAHMTWRLVLIDRQTVGPWVEKHGFARGQSAVDIITINRLRACDVGNS